MIREDSTYMQIEIYKKIKYSCTNKKKRKSKNNENKKNEKSET